MSDQTDAELVEAARNGDVSGFGELYRRHYAAAVGVAYCALGDPHLAEDAAQEAFAVACREIGRLRRADRFGHWVTAICRRVATRIAKTRRRNMEPATPNLSANEDPVDERRDTVRQAVQRLPRSAREVIALHYFSGLSHQQIAESLGISPQAVHGRLIRARRKIADDLARNGMGRRMP